jgi:hypothetical protein
MVICISENTCTSGINEKNNIPFKNIIKTPVRNSTYKNTLYI